MNTPDTPQRLGFIGLGVMGGPMAANLVKQSGLPVTVFDLDPSRTEPLRAAGADVAATVAEVAAAADVVFLSLPDGPAVEAVVLGPGGVAEQRRAGQLVVDTSTSPVRLAQRMAEELAGAGKVFVDAPVAKTRQAAIDGTLSIMVGTADAATYTRVEPLLRCMASDVNHCGPPGAGALVKLLNNHVVFSTVVALAEALSVARRSGLVDDTRLLDVLSAGSAASFTLDNHGRKALLPDDHPTAAFSARYMRKDSSYVVDAADALGLRLPGAELNLELLRRTIEAGYADNYHTAVIRVIESTGDGAGDAAGDREGAAE